jgi:hypothetical protein
MHKGNILIIRYIAVIFFLLLTLLSTLNTSAQTDSLTASSDTAVYYPGKKMARKATLLSIVPGLGQIHNGKYYKVPIIYLGVGTFAYFIHYTNGVYNEMKMGYANVGKPGPYKYYDFDKIKDWTDVQKKDFFKKYKDQYRRWRDMNVIGLTALYFLNIIDANIDANFLQYDVSPDLSIHLKPSIIQNDIYETMLPPLKPTMNVSLSLRF